VTRSPSCSWKSRPPTGRRAVPGATGSRRRRPGGSWRPSIEADGVKLYGLQTEIDRIQRDINALGAVNLAALDELTAARERKTFLDAQNGRPEWRPSSTLEDAIHKIDLETRDLLARHLQHRQRAFRPHVPQPCSAAAVRGW
jgi:hypothetical protein